MRYLLTLAMLLGAATAAPAQPPREPAPSIGLPLPTIGLPLPTIGLQPPAEPVFSPSVPSRRHGPRRHRQPAPILLFGVPDAFGYDPWQQSPVPGVLTPDAASMLPVERADPAQRSTGRLLLELTPRDAQVFVDDEYVGTSADHNGEFELRAGTRRIDVRAPNFEALSFDVRIAAGETITYRGALKPESAPQRMGASPAAGNTAKEPAPSAPAMFYLIPGCYLGNVPPDQVKLPPGCDSRKAITHMPKQ